ncbi:MAG: CRTAC1 family protein [Saprospiraceae bacterium]|nr:CRTAC1 family protein [Saprospiraceae bacterium]
MSNTLKTSKLLIWGFSLLSFLTLCCIPLMSKNDNSQSTNQKINDLVEQSFDRGKVFGNVFRPEILLLHYDSILKLNISADDRARTLFEQGNAYVSVGDEIKAVQSYNTAISMMQDPLHPATSILVKKLAVANLRIGERQNCIKSHSGESCLLPFRGSGIHSIQEGSNNAIMILLQLLERNPEDYEGRWLLNIAYMTLGRYPTDVPKKWLVPNLYKDPEKSEIKAFTNVLPQLGMHSQNLAGGVILEDFDGDNLLDILLSEWNQNGKMHFYKNNGNDGFSEITSASGLENVRGGLNINQVDYNNDGLIDIFILRGAWLNMFGEVPNSLLKNNGDGTFTDVTIEAGLLSYKPTQTATWCDFNKDGWIDVFIGNESFQETTNSYTCELYINTKDGKFKEVAQQANCAINKFVKGVCSGDYNNDGLSDLYLSTLYGGNMLLKNTGTDNGIPQFIDATNEAGIGTIKLSTFPTWFWDYNNDGWLDLFVCGYDFGITPSHSVCTDALNIPNFASKMYLFKNNQNGTFTDVSKENKLNSSVFAMGANFGDINNDGYLDMYLATGNPNFETLIPNKLYVNRNGKSFQDVTIAARVGNLQKGHGVGISDLDNDGDQDIFVEIGGAYPSDVYHNSFFINPGQNNNNWTHIRLEGKETNRAAIGSRVKIVIKEQGKKREIYRDICSGGSFGASSLRCDTGLGTATEIDSLIVTWQKTGKQQIFTKIPVNKSIKIVEGDSNIKFITEKVLRFSGDSSKIPMCFPSTDKKESI